MCMYADSMQYIILPFVGRKLGYTTNKQIAWSPTNLCIQYLLYAKTQYATDNVYGNVLT